MVRFLLPLLLLTSFSVLAQGKKNVDPWIRIDSLVSSGHLPKTALTEVNRLYAQAKAKGDEPTAIKALIYTIDLQANTREDADKEGLLELQAEQRKAKGLSKAILSSLLAERYTSLSYNMFAADSRATFDRNDVNTWTFDDFQEEAGRLYLVSIENRQLLQHTRVSDYDTIIIKGDLRNLRPTLYDLLAHRAADFFDELEGDPEPEADFKLDEPAAFAPAADFAAHRFARTDTSSAIYRGVVIYQQILSFHLHDADPDALIDADIRRLDFVRRHTVLSGKDNLFRVALEHITSSYGLKPATVMAWYRLANYHADLGSKYKPLTDTLYRYEKLEAESILKRLVSDSNTLKKSNGWSQAFSLLSELQGAGYHIQLLRVNLPAQPFLSLVSYINTRRLYLRIVPVNAALLRLQSDDGDKYWRALLDLKPIRTWQQDLPDTKDLQEHNTEIKIEGLPIGAYVLLSSTSGRFQQKDVAGDLAATTLFISRITGISQNDDMFILDRETGRPLAGAKVTINSTFYDYKTKKLIQQNEKPVTADANGYVHVAAPLYSNLLRGSVKISYKDDSLTLSNHFYVRSFAESNNVDTSTSAAEKVDKATLTSLFTDRGIYRPGQTVHFKGIVSLKDSSGKPTLRTDFRSMVYLSSYEGVTVDSVSVSTNDYGSFSGTLRLPANTLTGVFSIRTKNGSGYASFSVEEYKRPKFTVSFDSVKKAYRLNDRVHITGKAIAFAGNSIGGATVRYNVVRNNLVFYEWPVRGNGNDAPMVTSGETTTDVNGNFAIDFTALADPGRDSTDTPFFNYSVNVDVIDISGETHSQTTNVRIGQRSLLLIPEISPMILRDSLRSVSIFTNNINGVFQSLPVQLDVFALVPEQRLVHERLWPRPDQRTMSYEEFIRDFPHEEWATETDIGTWPRGAKVLSVSATSRADGRFALDKDKLLPGHYLFEFSTQDSTGHTIKASRAVEVFDAAQTAPAYPTYAWKQNENLTLQPGEEDRFRVGSSTDIFLISRVDQALEKNKLHHKFRFEQLNRGIKTELVKPSEADRGGYQVSYFFVRDNRLFQFNQNISVPWNNKLLRVEYVSFRDKTQPGSGEKWKLKISGLGKEAVKAEVLASMYDASLDDLSEFEWSVPSLWPTIGNYNYWNSSGNFDLQQSSPSGYRIERSYYPSLSYDELAGNMNDLMRAGRSRKYRDKLLFPPRIETAKYTSVRMGVSNKTAGYFSAPAPAAESISMDGNADSTLVPQLEPIITKAGQKPGIDARRNLQETAFFLPNLYTDDEGNVELSFTVPEALTKWKVQALAHTKDLSFGLAQKTLVTSKDLMVQPNMPRFLRQGDHIELAAKIVNTTDSEMTGQAQLELMDAATGQPVDGWFMNTFPNQYFTVAAHQSEVVRFPVQVPMQFAGLLTWRMTASTGGKGAIVLSDGEEDMLPVVSNRVLITETISLPMKSNGTQVFHFDPLLKSGNSETLQNHALTVEYTSNPTWYVVQALPYLMTFPYECAEQTWNRYYANALASQIVNASPAIRKVLDRWQASDTSALLSNLQKNEELTHTLLAETPWVLDAQDETAQKKSIAVLYDTARIRREGASALARLKDMASQGTGLPWFKGGSSDTYITQYVLSGIGRLKKLGAVGSTSDDLDDFVHAQFFFLDKRVGDNYKAQVKNNLKYYRLSPLDAQYLYVRSFFPKEPAAPAIRTAMSFYLKQAAAHWGDQSTAIQAMIAVVLERNGQHAQAQAILRSLLENSIYSEEMGRYWKNNTFGYSWSWWMAPIETQALLIEAFSEAGGQTRNIDEMKAWLLKNKQTNNWSTTRATADACYAMLLRGRDWLDNSPQVHISLGSTPVTAPSTTEAGTGFFRTSIDPKKINPEMGTISVTVAPSAPSAQPVPPSWGSVYWQYFEDVDKVKSAANTPMFIAKKLMLETAGKKGPELTPVQEGQELHVGDKLHILIELKVDRDMDYVQLKDTRASVLEPADVLSSYEFQNGASYYRTTGDLSTSYFFDNLPKGTYVFDYIVHVTHPGECSNGITTAQCLYAPEFSAHSESLRITVTDR